MEPLLKVLKIKALKEVGEQDIKDCMLSEPIYKLESKNLGNLLCYIQRETKSLIRMEALYGQSPVDMDVETLERHLFDTLTCSWADYKAKTEEYKTFDDPIIDDRQGIDFRILHALMKRKGKELTKKDLVSKIVELETDFGVMDYFFKVKMEWDVRDGHSIDGVTGVLYAYMGNFAETKEELAKHVEFNAKFIESHVIEPPKLVGELNTRFMPYAIRFFGENKIVVLEADEPDCMTEKEARSMPPINLKLSMYDLNTKELIRTIDTNKELYFLENTFTGNLDVGSDGLIYVNGGLEVCDSELNKLRSSDIEFEKAKEIIRKLNGEFGRMHMSQVTEENGIFYMHSSTNMMSREPSVIYVVGENGLIGDPIVYDLGCGGTTDWDFNPRFFLTDSRIYLKMHHTIESFDKGLQKSGDELETKSELGEDIELMGCIPSNHVVSSAGVLYAVTRHEGEVMQSIKGYCEGKFVTHVNPENYSSGSASLRSMDISKKGKLAYSDVFGKKIHVYQVSK